MAITVKETGLSPRLNMDPKNPKGEVDYFVDGLEEGHTIDDAVAAAVIEGYVWLTFRLNGTFWTRIYQTGVLNCEMVGMRSAKVTLQYGLVEAAPAPSKGGPDPNKPSNGQQGDGPDPTEILGPEWRFSTDGGTRHITQSIRTKKAVIDTGTDGNGIAAPDFKRVIGLSADRVGGCDIGVSDLNWSYTMKGVNFNRNFWRVMTALSYTTNSEKFMGAAPGEILFRYGEAHTEPGNGWIVTLNFSERPNEKIGLLPQLSENSPANSAEKGGHDYIWYLYGKTEVGTAPYKFSIDKPIGASLEQVYPMDSDIEMQNLQGVFINDLRLSDLFELA